ncbi:MAG: hypothetical protein QNK49_03615 [Porticoccus sp.]
MFLVELQLGEALALCLPVSLVCHPFVGPPVIGIYIPVGGPLSEGYSITHNRFYPTQKQFVNAILHFLRNTIPKKWTDFRSQVSDNLRIISHQNFRVLE